MVFRALVIITALILPLRAQDEDFKKSHVKLYKKTSAAVVGIRGSGGKGSGVVIHRSGWILTSILATGQTAQTVWVYSKGHKRIQGQVIERVKDLEFALVKIDPEHVQEVLEIGDSEAVKVGQVSYVLGDSFDSIFTDDQVAITLGKISGIYENRQVHDRAQYKGQVIETTASVNPGSDGGALIDGKGRLVGMMTLNYNESKFTSLAIPMHKLKAAIEKHVRISHPPVWTGFIAEGKDGKIAVQRVSKDGPAEKAGMKVGDEIVRFADRAVGSIAEIETALKGFGPKESVKIVVKRGGKEETLSLVLEEKEFY